MILVENEENSHKDILGAEPICRNLKQIIAYKNPIIRKKLLKFENKSLKENDENNERKFEKVTFTYRDRTDYSTNFGGVFWSKKAPPNEMEKSICHSDAYTKAPRISILVQNFRTLPGGAHLVGGTPHPSLSTLL